MIKRIVIGIIVVGLLALVGYRLIRGSGEEEQTPDVPQIRSQRGVPVEVAEVETGSLEVWREFTGTLRGVRSATVRANTGDGIVEVPVRVGQPVRTGHVLVRQSSRGSQAAVPQAEVALEQASRRVDRLRPLFEAGAISEQDFDDAGTALELAEANLEAARKAVVLTSPIDGVVTAVLERVGTMPAVGDPLARVADLSSLLVLLDVSPEEATELQRSQPAVLPEVGGLRGRVTRIALQADPRTRLLEVELTFPGGDGPSGEPLRIVPGSLTTTRIRVASRDSTLLVPRSAIRDEAVWVVNAEELAHRRAVTPGLEGEDRTEILQGVQEGERVVTAGATLLTEGARTRIVGGNR